MLKMSLWCVALWLRDSQMKAISRSDVLSNTLIFALWIDQRSFVCLILPSDLMMRDNLFEVVTQSRTFYVQVNVLIGWTLSFLFFWLDLTSMCLHYTYINTFRLALQTKRPFLLLSCLRLSHLVFSWTSLEVEIILPRSMNAIFFCI